MLKLKKVVVAVVLGVGYIASAQAWWQTSPLGTLTSDQPLVAENAFSVISTPILGLNANVLDWYNFSVSPEVTSATGSLNVTSTGFNLGVGFSNLTFSVYEGTYTGGIFDALKIAFPSGLNSVGSFGLQSDGTLSGSFNFNPAVSDYTLVISGLAAELTLGGSTNYTFTLGEVSAVPEPGEYAMLLAGLGVIGAVVRRRRI
jgi:hypothetical protein